MNVGSLCSGYGGLDLALGLPVAWHVEYDAAPAKILAARFPGVPNYGDLTAVDWAELEPVDVLTAGFPCQPVSLAGARAGTEDSRWLFDDICTGIGRMGARPRWLFFENVRGLLSANGGDAMARVVHGLARLGYVGSWRTVRASDVGAPHRRERIFIVATDADGTGGEARDERPGARDTGRLQPVDGGGAVAPHPAHDGLHGADAARRRGTRPQDGGVLVADPGRGRPNLREQLRVHEAGSGRVAEVAWGQYEPTIRHWEHLTRPAPSPTDDRGRLAPVFVEWMMGLPTGWVTDIDIPRTAQLKALGNGVVPQQAAHAWRLLTAAHLEEKAA